ncbi:hypothetical protein AZE42_09681, partial [Rhizopogon vesiculosus]
RTWGVPIPALYHTPTDTAILSSESLTHILRVLSERGVAHWWDGPIEDFLTSELLAQFEGGPEVWRKGMDTMDVWFDSGSNWSTLDAPTDGRKHRADVCLEGTDQHRGWFQSQLLTSVGAASGNHDQRPASPYKTLITHGMVLDEAGKKMSKSLGNIVSPMTIIHGGKDKKKEPAYGADVLRLWAATVEYWRDMSIGPTVLAQCAESMRKIRNSSRFILGNIGTIAQRKHFIPVEHSELGLAERFVMNELYKLDQTATEGYASYNFPKVMNSLSNFANITLSSLYFDITKDCLYANDIQSVERRAVVTTLAAVLDSMTSVMAPVLPYLAEEIHSTLRGGDAQLSVFAKKWTPVSAEWNDPQAEKDMTSLLKMRIIVLSLLEKARGDKHLKNSLEAEVDIILPNDISTQPYFLQLIEREQTFLKTLFIVSDANITDEGSLGTSSFAWRYISTMSIPDTDLELAIRVRPSSLSKCPRCWTYTREEGRDLCGRCEGVIMRAD